MRIDVISGHMQFDIMPPPPEQPSGNSKHYDFYTVMLTNANFTVVKICNENVALPHVEVSSTGTTYANEGVYLQIVTSTQCIS